MSNLKKKTVNGFKWNTIEQVSVQIIRFVLGLILARLLLPEAYGITALIGVFMAVSQVFIFSGFGNALIQKKNRTDVDYATVFYFNLLVSVICWLGLFFARNWFARFFNEPLLVEITPVIGLNLIFNALSLVQRTRLTAELDFKTQAKSALTATLISGIFGITLAYNGFGVWALVFQSVSRTFFNSLILWISNRWIPPATFSFISFKKLFSFGSKLMISSLINTIYQNLYSLIIGKFFTAADLAFYGRAKQFKNLPANNLTSILRRVTFPIFSSMQNDEVKLLLTFKKFIKMSLFVVAPLMIWLLVFAKPIIFITIGDKWLPSVELLQLLCLVGMMYPIHALNLTILQIKGRSDLFLKLEIIKKAITTIIIIITFSISVKAMVIGSLIGSIIALFINTHYTKELLDYGLKAQFKDFIPVFLLSIVLIVVMPLSVYYIDDNYLKISIGSIIGLISYLGCAYLFKMESLNDVKEIIKHIKQR